MECDEKSGESCMKSAYCKILELVEKEQIIFAVFSRIHKGADKELKKTDLRPVVSQKKVVYQLTHYRKKKVFHENLSSEEVLKAIKKLMENQFAQAFFYAEEGDYQILINKKREAKVYKSPPSRAKSLNGHNRKKEYLLEEGIPHDFLVHLGIMTSKGRVIASKYNKFKQINRYLEMVEDAIKNLPQNREINIVDFGCGKAYLTFALYDYLVRKKQYKVKIVGLDLKEDVVKFCNDVARSLDYKTLNFYKGSIDTFKNQWDIVDMVITLHACDTATDDALIQAIRWKARVILSVPCCHHEIRKQLKNEIMAPLEKHGILKERLSALVTDALRAELLESAGYKVQVLEFIDTEHTPKNILIRAVRHRQQINKKQKNYERFRDFWSLTPYLEAKLSQLGTDKIEEGSQA